MFEDMSVFYDIQEYEGVFESMNEYISSVWVFVNMPEQKS